MPGQHSSSHTSMSSAELVALERLEILKRQNPPTRLRSIVSGNAPIPRTYPRQDTLLRVLSLPGSQQFLTIALPNNFVSWVIELSSSFKGMLDDQVDKDLPMLYTAARFGQAQVCGQNDETLQHICAVMENELSSSSNSQMAPWDDVSALSSSFKEWTGLTWDRSIGFEYMIIDPATVSSKGKKKFNFRCASCKRLGLCVCVFIDFLEQMEAMVRVGYCTRRALAKLTKTGLVDENEVGANALRFECFCGDRDMQARWTKVFACAHAFHTDCVSHWIQQHPKNYGSTTCPMCRAEFHDQEEGCVAADYMRYIRNCYEDLWWWKQTLAFEKENDNLWIGPMRLDPPRHLRAAPYDLLSPSIAATAQPLKTISSKVVAAKSYQTVHADPSSAQEYVT